MLKRYISMFAVAMVTVHLPQSHVWCLVHSTLCSKAVLFFSAVLCSRLFQQQENWIYFNSLLLEFDLKANIISIFVRPP